MSLDECRGRESQPLRGVSVLRICSICNLAHLLEAYVLEAIYGTILAETKSEQML